MGFQRYPYDITFSFDYFVYLHIYHGSINRFESLLMIELFSRSHAIGSYLIRLRTWSKWSHTAILTPDNTVIEAAWPHGVREIDYDEWAANKTEIARKERNIPNPEKSLRFWRLQIHKRYDVFAIIGILFERNWSDPSQWYCSELNESGFAEGGLVTFDQNCINFISPQDRWSII